MKIRNLILGCMCAVVATAWAVPAKRGVTHRFTQPDGTVVSLQLGGDERSPYYLTTDGHVVIGSSDGFFYASMDANGEIVNTNKLAHDPDLRARDEVSLLQNLNNESVCKALFKKNTAIANEAPASRSNNQDGKGRFQTNYPTEGNVKTLVILVNYTDVKFTTPDANDYFTRMLNEEGFSDNGAYGSCRDFYMAASGGKFVGEFDVYGPVELPHPQSYYGANGIWGIDTRVQQMIIDAVAALDEQIDYRDYDLDNDAFIDNVFVFYAGIGEAQGGGPDSVWPHQSTIGMSIRYRYDGVFLNRYACSSELMASGETDGIGTFCHEFGHVLGIPDLYNTENSSVSYTPGDYSTFDSGCYLGNSKQPPTLSAFERNSLGWLGDDLVEITGPASCTLEHILTSNKAYLINTDNENEFFLFENRQKTGWDSLLPGNGMLIWHIDFDKTVWQQNEANNNPSHQHIDLVEANGNTGSTTWVTRRYPFPGTNKVTSFTFDGKPSFQSWSGKDLGLPITNIQETNGVITFDVAGGGDDPASIRDVSVAQDIICAVAGKELQVKAEGGITVTDLTGRVIATATGELSKTLPAPGVYIVSTQAGSQKILVK